MDNNFKISIYLKAIIKELVSQTEADLNTIRHEINHGLCTLFWVNKLFSDPPFELEAAAFLHDCDRFFPQRRARAKDFSSYPEYKKEHSRRSAMIAAEILKKIGQADIEKTAELILIHEVGGSNLADILRDADSLAFFDKNLIDYAAQEGWPITLEKIDFMFKRMGDKAKKIFLEENFSSKLLPEMQSWLNKL